jgi:GNAT superfamily N-acetyltransferase
MIIKRANDNRYVAEDENGRQIGSCAVIRQVQPRIFPDRPVQYVIRVKCTDECRDLLYGAAVTRARILASKETEPCRVYADIDASAKEDIELIQALGFHVRDGIMRMRREVTDERVSVPAPPSCTIVRDFLENPEELKKCLRRYNECFGVNYNESWLENIASMPDFARILMVSPEGLCGEAMVWSRGDTGVVGIIQTARAWRRQGVATYLMEDARKYFSSLKLKHMTFDAWVLAPGCVPLARKCGYRKGEMLTIYPELRMG